MYHHCFNIESGFGVRCGLVALKPLLGRFGDIVLYGSLGVEVALETSAFQCHDISKSRVVGRTQLSITDGGTFWMS